MPSSEHQCHTDQRQQLAGQLVIAVRHLLVRHCHQPVELAVERISPVAVLVQLVALLPDEPLVLAVRPQILVTPLVGRLLFQFAVLEPPAVPR